MSASPSGGRDYSTLTETRFDFTSFGSASSRMPSFNVALAFAASTPLGSVTVRLKAPRRISLR